VFLLYPVKSQPRTGTGCDPEFNSYSIIRDSYDKIKKVLYDFLNLWRPRAGEHKRGLLMLTGYAEKHGIQNNDNLQTPIL